MSEKILVIDDDKVMLTMLQMSLTKDGYEVLIAHDGQEGLKLIDQEKPDLVITDLLIPKVDGIGVCTKVKSTPALSHIKVIIISAIKNLAIQREAKSCGADAFLEKPIESHVLNAAILALLTPDRPPR
jgi:DNA-binding response OmpR family regulator